MERNNVECPDFLHFKVGLSQSDFWLIFKMFGLVVAFDTTFQTTGTFLLMMTTKLGLTADDRKMKMVLRLPPKTKDPGDES